MVIQKILHPPWVNKHLRFHTGPEPSFPTWFPSLHPSPYVCSDAYDQSGLQEVQLEDGSTAYIQHTVHMPQSNTILAIQADGTIADLQAEATAIDPETISVLEQYTTKVKDYIFVLVWHYFPILSYSTDLCSLFIISFLCLWIIYWCFTAQNFTLWFLYTIFF